MTDEPPGTDDEPTIPLAESPADGLPDVADCDADLVRVADRLSEATGPLAIDAERASGHRYGQRAFLLQFRRDGAGTALVDPTSISDFSPLRHALAGTEWILHASTQDLPCLAELGLRPDALFDTEVAARLLGFPRVALASLTELLLGVRLAKGHGAADWSRRPLPELWIAYAALDVEFLIQLRDALAAELVERDRWAWAQQEFAALCDWKPQVRPDPWRRTSGIHSVRNPVGLAVVRELWVARDAEARRRDLAPGRLLRDSALVAAARALPDSRSELGKIPEFARQRRRLDLWWSAIEIAKTRPPAGVPAIASTRGDAEPGAANEEAIPPPRAWAHKNPEAAHRLSRARGFVIRSANELGLTPEVLIAPDLVRHLAWAPPAPIEPDKVAENLTQAGARQWQVDLTASGLAAALRPS